MAATIHPCYSNSTIIEAIVEVHFDYQLSNKHLDTILQAFSQSYECKKDSIIMYKADIGEKGLSIAHENTGQFRIHIQKSPQVLAQVFSNRLSVHWIGKYQGWRLFETEFLSLWKIFQANSPKIQTKKFGLRFINRIDKKTEKQPLKTWFKSSPNYPTNLLNSKSDFFYRGKWMSDDPEISGYRNIIITIAEAEPIAEKMRPILFDIDAIQTCDENVRNNKQMMHVINILHDAIWSIFSSSISKHYEKHLNKNIGA